MVSRRLSRYRQPVRLTRLGLRNFKAFGNDIEAAPMSRITLVYGPNSGGKSSLIQSILLLKQSEGILPRGGVLAPQGEFVDLAGFRAMVHRHDETQEMEIQIRFDDRTRQSTAIDMAFGKDEQHNTDLPVLRRIGYGLNNQDGSLFSVNLAADLRGLPPNEETITFRWADGHDSVHSYGEYIRNLFGNRRYGNSLMPSYLGRRYPELASLINTSDVLPVNIMDTLRNATFQAHSSVLPTTLDVNASRLSDNPDEFSQFLMRGHHGVDSISTQFQHLLDNISFLGPILDDPRRFYLTWGGRRSTVGRRGEYTFDILSSSDYVRDEVNKWFRAFDIPYELKGNQNVTASELTGTLSTMALEDSRTGTIVTPVDVGFGISQILPVIVEGVAGTSSIVCVDQPEVHLHPKLQAEIADLMIECKDKQWIVETHSELLARRLLRRVADPKCHIQASDVTVLYVDPPVPGDTKTGSTIRVIEVEPDGQFSSETPWPDGFFEDAYSEMMATIQTGGYEG